MHIALETIRYVRATLCTIYIQHAAARAQKRPNECQRVTALCRTWCKSAPYFHAHTFQYWRIVRCVRDSGWQLLFCFGSLPLSLSLARFELAQSSWKHLCYIYGRCSHFAVDNFGNKIQLTSIYNWSDIFLHLFLVESHFQLSMEFYIKNWMSQFIWIRFVNCNEQN